MAKRSSSKRELIDTGRDKMFAKRDEQGQFKEMDDVGRSLATDRGRAAKTIVESGHGDQGDGPRAAVKKRLPGVAAHVKPRKSGPTPIDGRRE
jgi:hypothetical protein